MTAPNVRTQKVSFFKINDNFLQKSASGPQNLTHVMIVQIKPMKIIEIFDEI